MRTQGWRTPLPEMTPFLYRGKLATGEELSSRLMTPHKFLEQDQLIHLDSSQRGLASCCVCRSAEPHRHWEYADGNGNFQHHGSCSRLVLRCRHIRSLVLWISTQVRGRDATILAWQMGQARQHHCHNLGLFYKRGAFLSDNGADNSFKHVCPDIYFAR